MKKKTILSGLLLGTLTTTASTLAAVNVFTKHYLYRSEIIKDDLSDLGASTIKIKNHKGLIQCGYLLEKAGATHTLLMLHELGKDASSLKPYVPYFEAMMPSANILLVDASAHGMSDGYIRGFGYHDVFDLMYWNKYLLQRFGDDHKIVLYGREMGANTCLNAAGLDKLKNVQAIISDSAYDDVLSYLTRLCFKEVKVAPYISGPMMRLIFKNEINLDPKDMDSVSYVKNNMIPTIYIHSKEDAKVPFKCIFPLYNKNKGECVLFPIKEDHLYEMNSEDPYSKTLEIFLNQNIR